MLALVCCWECAKNSVQGDQRRLMITINLEGYLCAEPRARIGRAGQIAVVAKMQVDGVETGSGWVDIVAYATVGECLAALDMGARIEITGTPRLRAWRGPQGRPVAGLAVEIATLEVLETVC